LDANEEETAISVITCWEIATLVRKGKISLPAPYPEWIERVRSESLLTILDIDVDVIEWVYNLPDVFHGDPADRIIAATALLHRARLATMDRKLLGYEFLPILEVGG